jgi:hypothetical protein
VPAADPRGGRHDHRRPGRGAGPRRRRLAGNGAGAGERVRRSIVVEDAIRTRVLPRYANTHIESSGAGRHTTRLREQARQLIHQAVGDYLIEAVELLADHGHRLLDDYRFDPRSGHWRHRGAPPDPAPSLTGLLDEVQTTRPDPGPGPGAGDEVLAGYLQQARALLTMAAPACPAVAAHRLPPELERLRDFHLPAAARR